MYINQVDEYEYKYEYDSARGYKISNSGGLIFFSLFVWNDDDLIILICRWIKLTEKWHVDMSFFSLDEVTIFSL